LYASLFASQVLYHLSHASSPFCSGYFGDRVLLSVQIGLDRDPQILHFLATTGLIGAGHQLFLIEIGLTNSFAQAGLEP
jgi:hypothetical protein